MVRFRQLAPLAIFVYIFLYYLWLFGWRGNEEMLVAGGDVFHFLPPITAFIILFYTYRTTSEKDRIFWLWLALGCLSYGIGQGIWIFYEMIFHVEPTYPNWADLFWLLQYVFSFIALLLRMYDLKHSFTAIQLIFDILTVMVVAVSLSWNFIFQPMFSVLTTDNFLFILTYYGYPVGELGLFFCALCLILAGDHSLPRQVLFPLVYGFLIYIIADTAYTYLVVNNQYSSASYLDPLWSLGLLLIGLAGLKAQKENQKQASTFIHPKRYNYRNFLPYTSIAILLVFTIQKHYRIMESLTYGLAITIVLVLIKQQRLTKDLIEKNNQLEEMNQTLAEKEQQLNDIFDNLDAVIWSRDFQTDTSMISIGVEKIFGYSQQELQNDPTMWKKAIHPDDVEKAAELVPTLSRNFANNSLSEFRVYLPNQDLKWVQVLRTPIYDEKGALIKVHAVITDITEHKQAEEKIQYMAYYDELTGLPNRNLFYKTLKKEMALAKSQGHRVAVIFIDLDRFKSVNDMLGHHIGDLLLESVSKRIKENLQTSGTICRIGGDEFTIVLPSQTTDESERISKEIIEIIGKPFSIEGHELFITPSIGISMYPDHGETEEELVKKADMAMYNAKDSGKNNYYIYTPELDWINLRKMKIENALRKAIDNGNEFTLHYQPKVDLTSGKFIGLEALVRWQHPEFGSISPTEFIPVAEETGLISDIGQWVLYTACIQMKEWQSIGLPKIPVCVNVSAHQLNDEFVRFVHKVLQDTGLEPLYLELEITESIMQNIKESSLILKDVKGLGVQLSIDDFGTGYSSLSYLIHLPVDCIKIDKSFIHDISDPSKGGVMVRTIIDLGRNLNFIVVAEGIETKQQIEFLQQNHCYIGQGYYFSKPLPADEILLLLKDSSAFKKYI